MPNSHYVPGREPPSLVDRLLGTSRSTALNIGLAIIGALVIASAIGDIEVSRTLSESEPLVSAAIGALLTVGGTLATIGEINPGYRMRQTRARIIEQIGSILVASGALAFAAGILLAGNRLALASVVIILAISIGWLLWVLAIHLSLKRIGERCEAELLEG